MNKTLADLPSPINPLHKIEQYIGLFLLFSLYLTIVINNIIDYDWILTIITVFSIYLYVKYRQPIKLKTNAKKILYLFIVYYGFFLFHVLITGIFDSIDARAISLISKALSVFATVYLLTILRVSRQFASQLFCTLFAGVVFISMSEIIYYAYYADQFSELLNGNVRFPVVFSDKGEISWIAGSIMLVFVNQLILNIRTYSWQKIILFSVSLVFILLFLGFSRTRSYLIGLPLVGIVLIYYYHKIGAIKLRHIAFGIVATGMVLTLILVSKNPLSQATSVSIQNAKRVLFQSDFSSSMGDRLKQYQVALDIIKKNPFWGIGDANYKEHLKNIAENRRDLISDIRFAKSSLSYSHLHNQFLMDFVNRGVIGFLISILVMMLPLIWFIKSIHLSIKNNTLRNLDYPLAGLGIMVSSLIFFQFGAILYYSHALLFFWLILFTITMVMDNQQERI